MLKFYDSWYNDLIDKGNEKILLLEAVQNLTKNNKKVHFLEIGMGTIPLFANGLHKMVDNYTIIEKKSLQHPLPENVYYIQDDFETAIISQSFDIILASHVIYYFQDLNKAIEKIINQLKNNGIAIFVVNGKDFDYGLTKNAVSKITKKTFIFTYDILIHALKKFKYKEQFINTEIFFKDHEELYKSLRLFFDLIPKEYENNKKNITNWLSQNIKGKSFKMKQKLFIVPKQDISL